MHTINNVLCALRRLVTSNEMSTNLLRATNRCRGLRRVQNLLLFLHHSEISHLETEEIGTLSDQVWHSYISELYVRSTYHSIESKQKNPSYTSAKNREEEFSSHDRYTRTRTQVNWINVPLDRARDGWGSSSNSISCSAVCRGSVSFSICKNGFSKGSC